MTSTERLLMLDMQAQAADMVAAITGIKAQFVTAGWDPGNAERMVIEVLRASSNAGTATK